MDYSKIPALKIKIKHGDLIPFIGYNNDLSVNFNFKKYNFDLFHKIDIAYQKIKYIDYNDSSLHSQR
jgi:hypothetical protein